MSKTYEIHSAQDLSKAFAHIMNYVVMRKDKGLPFQSLNLISKRFVKSKTSPQHRLYWACIAELQKGFELAGYNYKLTDIHEFIKREAGFTKMIELPNCKMVEINKSIADKSDDINIEEISKLIEFIKRWASENLAYYIED